MDTESNGSAGPKPRRKKTPRKSPPGSLLITQRELCELLAVPQDTWRHRVLRGQAPMPHSTMARTPYYIRSYLDFFVRNGRWPVGMKFCDSTLEELADG